MCFRFFYILYIERIAAISHVSAIDELLFPLALFMQVDLLTLGTEVEVSLHIVLKTLNWVETTILSVVIGEQIGVDTILLQAKKVEDSAIPAEY